MHTGEVDSAHAAVLFAEALPVVSTSQWMTFMDGVKINGQFINGNTIRSVCHLISLTCWILIEQEMQKL